MPLTVTTIADQSLFIILTGSVGAGKSFQVNALLTAKVDDEPVACPSLFLLAEASAEGTAAEVLRDPGACCVWPVADCDEALEALRECFPKAGPVTLGEAKRRWHKVAVRRTEEENKRALADDKHATPMAAPDPLPASDRDHVPLRSLVVDTATTLYQGSINKCIRDLKAEAERKQKGSSLDRAGKKDAPWNNAMNTNAFAAARCQELIDRLNAVTQHTRGLVCLVTVHTRPAVRLMSAGEGQEKQHVVVGECPALGATKTVDGEITATGYSATWNLLAAKANVVWHCFYLVPDLANVSLADINASPKRVTYGVLTNKAKVPKLGDVMWTKCQGGEGPWSVFSDLPLYWHPAVPCDPRISAIAPTPNLGKVVAFALQSMRDG